jgi:hypothetical protein
MDKLGTLAGSERLVATTMTLQIPNHADHVWIAVLPVFFEALQAWRAFSWGASNQFSEPSQLMV